MTQRSDPPRPKFRVMAKFLLQFSVVLDFLEQGKTITTAYSRNFLTKLCQNIDEKRNEKLAKLFCSQVVEILVMGFELIEHPLYSPDLALSDY